MPTAYELEIRLELEPMPDATRLIRVPASVTLPVLHRILQAAFGWTNSHLHQFLQDDAAPPHTRTSWIPPLRGEPPRPDNDRFRERDPKGVVLSTLLEAPGDTLAYEYDFGDGWTHVITLAAVIPMSADLDCPLLLDGENACPPEDCGGNGGYEAFCEALADPNHEQHEELAEWCGRTSWDPAAFDYAATRKALAKIRL